MNHRQPVRLLLLLALLLALPGVASAQSAADIMEEMREAYLEQIEGIENYTVVQRVMGNEMTIHFVRDEVEGTPFFRPQLDGDEMEQMEMRGAGQGSMGQGFFFRNAVMERMTHEGMDEVEGHACHLLRMSDFSDLEGTTLAPNEAFELESITLCVDEDEHVIRSMDMEGVMEMEGERREIETRAVLSDYRSVEGLLHPFRAEMTMSGMGMAPGQQAEMARMMEQMEAQLEQLPEAQRERMRQMMESRMEGMQGAMGMAAGEPVLIETVEVRVNEGPPEGGG